MVKNEFKEIANLIEQIENLSDKELGELSRKLQDINYTIVYELMYRERV